MYVSMYAHVYVLACMVICIHVLLLFGFVSKRGSSTPEEGAQTEVPAGVGPSCGMAGVGIGRDRGQHAPGGVLPS